LGSLRVQLEEAVVAAVAALPQQEQAMAPRQARKLAG